MKREESSAIVAPPRIQFAPLAGVSDLPTRLLCRRFGAELAFTEMVSSTALVMNSYKTEKLFTTNHEDQPLGVQIFGSDPEIMGRASEILESKGVSHININLGCPVKKVVKTNSGAALLKELSLTEKIIKSVIKAVSLPVSIKIRAGWSDSDKNISSVNTGLMAEACGVSSVTIHGRTAMQGYSGSADWDSIRILKERLKIPVIGNGDITTAEEAKRVLEETGCDGVMIGRGAIGNPWIFRECLDLLKYGKYEKERTPEERAETVIDHMNLMLDYYGSRIGVKKMRTHTLQYTSGLKNSAAFRREITRLDDPEQVKRDIRLFFRTGEVSSPTIFFHSKTSEPEGLFQR